MYLDVLVATAHLGELLLTVLALVGLDVSVPIQVLVERLLASVALRTEIAPAKEDSKGDCRLES